MKSMGLAVVLLAATCGVALADEATKKERNGYGYLSFGMGGINGYSGRVMSVTFGGEGMLFKGLGIGAEVGGIGINGGGAGIGSLNGSYHFRKASASRRYVPFITGGYSAGIGPGGYGSALNFGGGVTCWLKERIGLRLEMRDYVPPSFPNEHLFTGRIGLAFR